MTNVLDEKDPPLFWRSKIDQKKRGEIRQGFQRDVRSSRFQNEIESF